MNRFVRLPNTRHQKRATAIAIACGLLLALPSCGIPDLRKPVPVAPLPDTFNGSTSPENSSRVCAENFFNDPNLLGLIDQALTGNLEQKILAQDAQIAANEVLARRGTYLPFVSFGGGTGLNKISSFTPEGAGIRDDPFRPGQLLPNPLPNFIFGANITWQLDVWRQLRNARDAAALRFLSTNERRNYFVTRLVADIAENYYELIMLDKRIEILDQTIALQEQSLRAAELKKEAARGTELDVQRFQAEIRRNQSEKLIVNQQIIEVENRINFLIGRYPQRVERMTGDFIDLNLPALSLGVPSQLLQYRPDIRQAERELEATGLDVKVARANFYPRFIINSGVGYQAFNPKYLLITPEALIYNIAGDIVAPLVNKRAIQAEYVTANSRQLQALYDYKRTILNAFTEVINRINKVENYGRSVELKKQQVASLELSVSLATRLYQAARADYVDVLFAQRDLRDARVALVETKQQQLAAIVNTYQALGGGNLLPVFDPYVPPPFGVWKHFRHSEASEATKRVPGPIPPPPPGRGPEPLPPPPERRVEPVPPPPPPGSGPFQLPPLTPEGGPQPIPTPTEGGKESRTVSNTEDPPG
ncbi:MAG TPA: TolC family protein [Isosphaeraceae bacterium]|nr:TolC family protein [Isosphaeraceae bacterium]